jgi:hypothetical protein
MCWIRIAHELKPVDRIHGPQNPPLIPDASVGPFLQDLEDHRNVTW